MSQFGHDQINDVHLERLDFYADANDIFKDVAIADGISIVFKNMTKSTPGFTYVYHKNGEEIIMKMDNPGEELISLNPRDGSVVSKVLSFISKNNLGVLHDRVFPRDLFGIESNFVENNPEKVRLLDDDYRIDNTKEIKLFANDNEIIFSRKEKPITRATVNRAYNRMVEEDISGSKQLGVFGASYLFPVLKDIIAKT